MKMLMMCVDRRCDNCQRLNSKFQVAWRMRQESKAEFVVKFENSMQTEHHFCSHVFTMSSSQIKTTN
jgi:hypothetical protein